MFLNEADTDIYLALQTVFECLHWYGATVTAEALHLPNDTTQCVAYILNKDTNPEIEKHHGWLMNALVEVWYRKVYDPILLNPEEKRAITTAVETIKTDPVIIAPRMIHVLEFAWNNTQRFDSNRYNPNPWRPYEFTPPPQHFNYAHFIEVLKNLVI